MESFFALLQKNVLDRRTWATREELRIAIVTWIERTYHRPDLHRSGVNFGFGSCLCWSTACGVCG
jgi:transposase InsO family protein